MIDIVLSVEVAAHDTLFEVNRGTDTSCDSGSGTATDRHDDFPRLPTSSRDKILTSFSPPRAFRSQAMRSSRWVPSVHRQGAIGATLQTERKHHVDNRQFYEAGRRIQ